MIKAIVAYDRNRAIGAHNELPWMGRMKSDFARMRELTTGHAIIMGRKTFESIRRPLPNRQNIVLSRHAITAEGITSVTTLDEAYEAVEDGRDTYIFGGAQIYELALPTTDEIVATEIDTAVEDADAFFPPLDDAWHEASREHHDADADNIYSYDFVTYKRG